VLCYRQLSALQPLLNLINDTYSELSLLFGNTTQQNETAGLLRAASVLLCGHEMVQNDTEERSQYFDKLREKLRPDQRTSFNDSSTYVYDNSTSELMCVLMSICSQLMFAVALSVK